MFKSDEADKKYYVRYPAINAIARFRRRLEELVADLDAISLICVFSATLLFVSVLAAGSRGGILACMAASVLTLCVSLGTKKSYARTVGLVAAIGCGALLLLTTLDLDGAVWERIDSVNEEAYNLNNGRFTVWQMVLSQPSCWLPGCGLGNFHFAILPAYRAEPSAWFYHAENLYIELLAEMGIVGFVIGLIGLIWLILRIRWCVVTGRRGAPTFIATTLAVAAVALQSLVDFSLIIPSVFIPLAALVGCFLARTYSPEFGKKSGRSDQRKKAQRGSDQRTEKELPSNSLWSGIPTSIALLSLVLFSIWIGSQPLQGFAFAEQLNSEIGDLQQPSSERGGDSTEAVIAAIDPEKADRFASHPEVNLQVGRLLQKFAAEQFETQLPWPSNLKSEEKAALSEPAHIAATYRADHDQRMIELRKLTYALPQQVEALKRSAKRMAAAASACSLDWRGELGVLRSDLDCFPPNIRARNYARLLGVTGHSHLLPASIGSTALAAGEKEVGRRFLHDYLVRIPKQVIPVALGSLSSYRREYQPKRPSVS